MKYTSSKTEKLSTANMNSNNDEFQKLTDKKAEPIIDLLHSLELSGDIKKKPKDLPSEIAESNYNMELDSKLKTNDAAPATKTENIDEFVDDFVNDYLSGGVTVSQLASKLNSTEGVYTQLFPLVFFFSVF